MQGFGYYCIYYKKELNYGIRMKKLTCLLCLFCLFCSMRCENDQIEGDVSVITVLTVDYTTNEFLGGYIVPLDRVFEDKSLDLVCEYKAPSDFGSIDWYDKQSGKHLFGGSIIWMGKGERTYPKTILPASAFPRMAISTIPTFVPLFHDEYDKLTETDYLSVWNAVSNLQCVGTPLGDTPFYIYLYRPSTSVGDPKDWYWVTFMKH